MRRLGALLFVAALAATGVAAQQESRKTDRGTQGAHHGAAQHTQHRWRKWTVSLDDDPATRTRTFRLGPVNLPAHSDHMAVAQLREVLIDWSFEGWLTAYHPRLVDDTGAVLPGRLLHHVAFWNTGRPDFLCPNKEEHMFGAGGEMNDWPALEGFGYRIREGDRIRINTMFHNPTDTDYPRTYIEVRMEYKKATDADAAKMRSVFPTWFDVMQCGNSGYDLAPGRNVTAGEFTLGYSGTLLGVGGHLHDYGVGLELANVTRSEQVARLASTLDPQGRIQGMPIVTFLDRGGYRLNRGEKITVTATYNNRAGKPLPDGAMGIVVGYFLPDEETQLAALQRPKAHTGHDHPKRPATPARP